MIHQLQPFRAKLKKLFTAAVVLMVSATLFSCASMQTKEEKGTAIGAGSGAAVGAILGQAIGRDTQSTVIGERLISKKFAMESDPMCRIKDNVKPLKRTNPV